MKIPKLTRSYHGRKVLDFPGMILEHGKIYAVIGANGSGKSTLAKLLAGMIPADEQIVDLEIPSIGYMPQKNYGFRMTTQANILLNGKDVQRAEELMAAIGIDHLKNKRGDRLSGGETARMALIRLMMKYYHLVILDEPTAAMDMESSLISEKLITDYVAESRCALILVTHSLRQAGRIAHEVLYLHQGQLLEFGPTYRVLSDPKREETKQFLDFYGA